MEFTQACAAFIEKYREREAYKQEIADQDLSDTEHRKACERKLFEFNEEIARVAGTIHDALRELFEEGRATMVPPSLFGLSGRDILPYRDKLCEVVERLQVLSRLRR